MIDYEAIANDDIGGDIDTAFTALTAMTITQSRGEYLVNDKAVTNALGLVAANKFLDALEASPIPERVKRWMIGDGIDINHPDTVATLIAMAPPGYESVLALGTETVAKYPGITPAHLQKARTMRAEGRI